MLWNIFLGETIINSLFPYPIVNIITTLTIIFIITLAYNSSIRKRILITLYIFTCFIIGEMIVGFIYNVGSMSFNSEALYNNVFINFLVIVVVWTETVITQKFVNVKSNVKLPKIFVIAVSIVPIATITLEYFIMYNQGFNQTIRLVSMICVIASNFILIYLFDSYSLIFKDHIRSEVVKLERDYYHEQSQLLQSNNDDLRKFRHDIKNRLISLNALINNQKYEMASEQIISFTEQLDATSSFSNSHNVVIDSIINYKLSRAKSERINVSCKVTLPTELPYDSDDLVIIIGNLLDNAIEASRHVKDNPFINVNLNFDKNTLLIHVENNYLKPLNIVNNKIHTTKSDSISHGIGLRSIAETIKNYNGKADYKYDNNVFEATVLLF